MDLRSYFQRRQEVEESIGTLFAVIVSEATSDGGKAGAVSEVSRSVAAQLIAEGRARLATDSQAREYRAGIERARAAAEQERLASRVQVTLVSDQDLRTLKGQRPSRS